jgi:hypothetical protein
VLGQQFATILARTDPFDLAQALERHIRSLPDDQVRALINAASPRMNEWYRAEFTSLLEERDGERLKAAFAHTLKSNLRAIPFFGAEFCQGVIDNVPSDRAVALGEEEDQSPLPRIRPLAVGIVAVAIFIGGAAAQHFISTAQANARGPVVLSTPAPVVAFPATAAPSTTAPVAASAPVVHHAQHVALAPQIRKAAPPVAATAPPAPAPSEAAPTAAPASATNARPAIAPPVAAPAVGVHRAPAVNARHVPRTPPPGAGVKTIVAQQRVTPAPQPTEVDTSDMPRSYSDATPLPNATPPPVLVAPQDVSTPQATAAPSHGSWFHRTIMHLDPLKPNPGGWIHSSIMHVDPFKPHPKPTATATGGPQQ